MADKIILTEAGRSRLLQILNGLVPSIRTFGIITAENPMGEKFPEKINEERNNRLRDLLNSGYWGYRQVLGKYGNEEHPFFIRNIILDDLIRFAIDFKQESFIFAQNYTNLGAKGVEFSYYEQKKTGNKEVEDGIEISVGDKKFLNTRIRKIYINAEDEKDFYTEYKGKKFNIPFFDDATIHDENLDGFFVVPDLIFPYTESIKEKIQEINIRQVSLIEDNVCGYTAYAQRGIIKNLLHEVECEFKRVGGLKESWIPKGFK
jgi:hypothetical protein